jgi:excisionase family DNA binding protein
MPYKANNGGEIDDQAPGQQLWLVDDVAQYLRISKDEVYRLVARRAIPHIRVFRRKGIRFHPDAVEDWAKTGGSEDN